MASGEQSTPEQTLTEKATDESAEGKGGQGTETRDAGFQELYEQSLQSLQMGSIVVGRVVQVGPDVIMVDVGWKTEGYIPTREMKDEAGICSVQVGDAVEVLVDRRDSDGNLVLSREKAAKIKIWEDIKNAYEQNLPVKGTVVERVKGGLSVDVGIIAFLPGSQVDVRPVRDLDRYIGQAFSVNILKYDRKRSNVVLSRRAILEKERDAEKSKTLATIEEGKVMEGVIKNITDYGLFIDLGGIDGLLHVTDISWGRVTRPADHFNKGDRIKVKVLSFDREKERVALGLKQLTENPWEHIRDKFAVGSVIRGKVVNLTDYGVFVELEPGVEGLIHISEMFWTREIKHPSKVLSLGQEIDVMILDVNPDAKRISLGLKQLLKDPWDELEETYPPSSVVKGRVKNFTDFGMFLGIGNGIDGLVHMSEISWSRRKKTVSEIYKKGAVVEARVLNVDKEQKKFSLSIKQLHRNPWEGLSEEYHKGDVVEGYITSITDFGAFVEIKEGVEGLIHVSEMDEVQGKHPSEVFKLDDLVQAVILNIDEKEKRIALSRKALRKASEEKEPESFFNEETSFSTLGDILESAMKGKNSDDDLST